jgi:hypothetical protein
MQLSENLLMAIKDYFDHRKQQHTVLWNKDADLEEVKNAAAQDGLIYEASCGTFCFTSSNGESARIDESTYPNTVPSQRLLAYVFGDNNDSPINTAP